MKKEYVRPTISLYDIRMEDRIAAICRSFYVFNYHGDECWEFMLSTDGLTWGSPASCKQKAEERS